MTLGNDLAVSYKAKYILYGPAIPQLVFTEDKWKHMSTQILVQVCL